MEWLLRPVLDSSANHNSETALETLLKNLATRQSRRPGFGVRLFVQACVLAGCDYAPNQLHGVGLVNAFKLVRDNAHRNDNVRFEKVLTSMPRKARADIDIKQYEVILAKSEAIFYYHLVRDATGRIQPLLNPRFSHKDNGDVHHFSDHFPFFERFEGDLSFLGMAKDIPPNKAFETYLPDETAISVEEKSPESRKRSRQPVLTTQGDQTNFGKKTRAFSKLCNPYRPTKKSKDQERLPLNVKSPNRRKLGGNPFAKFTRDDEASSSPESFLLKYQQKADIRFVKRRFPIDKTKTQQTRMNSVLVPGSAGRGMFSLDGLSILNIDRSVPQESVVEVAEENCVVEATSHNPVATNSSETKIKPQEMFDYECSDDSGSYVGHIEKDSAPGDNENSSALESRKNTLEQDDIVRFDAAAQKGALRRDSCRHTTTEEATSDLRSTLVLQSSLYDLPERSHQHSEEKFYDLTDSNSEVLLHEKVEEGIRVEQPSSQGSPCKTDAISSLLPATPQFNSKEPIDAADVATEKEKIAGSQSKYFSRSRRVTIDPSDIPRKETHFSLKHQGASFFRRVMKTSASAEPLVTGTMRDEIIESPETEHTKMQSTIRFNSVRFAEGNELASTRNSIHPSFNSRRVGPLEFAFHKQKQMAKLQAGTKTSSCSSGLSQMKSIASKRQQNPSEDFFKPVTKRVNRFTKLDFDCHASKDI